MIELASGSAQSDLAHTAFFSVSVIKPSKKTQAIFNRHSKVIVNQIFNQEENIKGLIKLKNLLLSKMSNVKLEKEKKIMVNDKLSMINERAEPLTTNN